MNLPIDALKQIDDFVQKCNEQSYLTPRQRAIRETAKLLVFLTHDEHLNNTDTPCKYTDVEEQVSKLLKYISYCWQD